MKTAIRISAILLSICIGLVFLFSAYAKLFPVIESFEFTFIETGFANWYTAPLLARAMIGLEILLGILLLLNYQLRKITIPFTLALLLFFILYLLVQILSEGNQGNCGCFGEQIYMTPLQAIIKNLVLFVLAVLVLLLHEGWKSKYNALLLTFLSITSLGLPFVLNPVEYDYTSNNLQEKVNYPLNLELLYQPEDSDKVEIPKTELRKGKQVLAFMSLSCPHCRIAAKKFHLIKKNNPALPIYFVLNGKKEKLEEFLKDTKTNNIPYSFCLGKTFVQLASAQLPRIYYLEDGMVIKKVDYFELNQYALEAWIEEK